MYPHNTELSLSFEPMYLYIFLTQLLGKKKRCFILLNALILMRPVYLISGTFCFLQLLSLNHEHNLFTKQKSSYTLSLCREKRERKNTAPFNPCTLATVPKCINPPKAT